MNFIKFSNRFIKKMSELGLSSCLKWTSDNFDRNLLLRPFFLLYFFPSLPEWGRVQRRLGSQGIDLLSESQQNRCAIHRSNRPAARRSQHYHRKRQHGQIRVAQQPDQLQSLLHRVPDNSSLKRIISTEINCSLLWGSTGYYWMKL